MLDRLLQIAAVWGNGLPLLGRNSCMGCQKLWASVARSVVEGECHLFYDAISFTSAVLCPDFGDSCFLDLLHTLRELSLCHATCSFTSSLHLQGRGSRTLRTAAPNGKTSWISNACARRATTQSTRLHFLVIDVKDFTDAQIV
jgi:hypothetical protein